MSINPNQSNPPRPSLLSIQIDIEQNLTTDPIQAAYPKNAVAEKQQCTNSLRARMKPRCVKLIILVPVVLLIPTIP